MRFLRIYGFLRVLSASVVIFYLWSMRVVGSDCAVADGRAVPLALALTAVRRGAPSPQFAARLFLSIAANAGRSVKMTSARMECGTRATPRRIGSRKNDGSPGHSWRPVVACAIGRAGAGPVAVALAARPTARAERRWAADRRRQGRFVTDPGLAA